MSQAWTAEIRTAAEEGKGASRRLRNTGKVPAIIYGANKDAVSVTLDGNFIKHALEKAEVFNTVLTVSVTGGAEEMCVVKDIQRHPATGMVAHIDLQRAGADNKLVKKVPLKFVGKAVAPGVKKGGLMSFLQSTVEVTCLAKNLPSAIEIDVSSLEEGASMRLSDLVLPEGVSITALSHGNADYDQSVVSVSKPKRK
ncbi:50S ribosomal protein L25/general stress protein Ctc [Thiomicrorhabdus aquaedulcis]|uniref:50S ribosomal protein L25/general stress protein Ctc n=1 Tax=Thiomicrorhabdus aquaedulcis TaxID=2211106 RepID=UPI000FDAB6CA|nr:50S ribosomal protein L25/general stress protein Ctc [Thiomicrorhabdus aquaedulcis]